MSKKIHRIHLEKLYKNLDSIGIDGAWEASKDARPDFITSNGLRINIELFCNCNRLCIIEEDRCKTDDWFEATATTATGVKKAINKYDRLVAEYEKNSK